MSRWPFVIFLFAVALLLALLSTRFPGSLDNDFTVADIVRSLMVLLLVGPGVFYAYRGQGSRALRNALLWVAIFAAVFMVVAYREEAAQVAYHLQGQLIPSSPRTGEMGETVLTRAEGGHFYADAYVNGQRVRFMVDTGASRVVLSYEDAGRIGLDPASLDYTMAVSTAAGLTMNAAVKLDYVMIGELRIEGVKAAVAKPGMMDGSLLGMSYLERLDGYRIEGNTLRMWKGEK